MNAHILITDEDTHDTVINNSFWALKFNNIGIIKTINDLIELQFQNNKKPFYAMICDIFTIRENDLIFFYKRQVGFYGIYKAISLPFFDTTKYDNIDYSYPIRIKIKCINYFEKPIPEEYLFATKEYESKFWCWFYRKIHGARGVNTITPEATESMIELLVKINGNTTNLPNNIKVYEDRQNSENEIILPLRKRDDDSKVFSEDALRYYIIRNIGIKEFSEKIFGKKEDIEWYSNNVPYHVSGKNIDILVYHKNMKYTGFPLRYQYSVVELKRDVAKEDSVSQVIDYSKWVSTRLANSEIEIIQPIIIAYDFDKRTITKSKMVEFNNRKIKLFKYRLTNNTEIDFDEVIY